MKHTLVYIIIAFVTILIGFHNSESVLAEDVQIDPDIILALDISPTEPHYALARLDGRIEITNYETGAAVAAYKVEVPGQRIPDFDPDAYEVQQVIYAPTGDKLAVSASHYGYGGVVYIVNLETQEVRSFDSYQRINDMSWNPDGTKLVLALQSGYLDQSILSSIEIWNIVSGETEMKLSDMGSENNYSAVAVAWSKTNIIAYSIGLHLVFWDAEIEQEIENLTVDAVVRDIVWSPDDTLIATLSSDRNLSVWDLAMSTIEPQNTVSVITEHLYSDAINWIDNSRVVASIWTSIEVWDVIGGKLETVIETDNWIFGIIPISDREFIYAGPHDLTTYVFD